MNSVIAERSWIGLTDMEEEDVFRWESTGELPTWTNWWIQQPLSPPGVDSDCVHVFIDGRWADERCESLRYFLCEQPEY